MDNTIEFCKWLGDMSYIVECDKHSNNGVQYFIYLKHYSYNDIDYNYIGTLEEVYNDWYKNVLI